VEYDADTDTDNEQELNDEAYPIQAPDYDFDEELEDENAYDRIDQDEIDELNDDAYDRIDQEEIDEIMAEPGQGNQDVNPVDRRIRHIRVDQNDPAETAVTDDEDDITVATESSRPMRNRREPMRLTFAQTVEPHVTFEDDE
jgi:hypothetical protein